MKKILFSTLSLSLLLFSCKPQTDESLKETVDTLQKQVTILEKRVEKLEKSLKAPGTGQKQTTSKEIPLSNLVQISSKAQFDSLIQNGVVVADMYADWCPPCKKLAPLFKEVAAEYNQKATFVKINVDKQQEIAGEYKVQSIPTVLVFKEGKVAETIVGLAPKGKYTKAIEAAL